MRRMVRRGQKGKRSFRRGGKRSRPGVCCRKKDKVLSAGDGSQEGGLCPFPGVSPACRRDLSEAVGGRGGAEENGNFTFPKILPY